MLKLIGMPRSRAFRVLWALEELELPHEWDRAMPHSAEVRGAGGEGKVPLLVVDGQTLSDSSAILTFLADREGRLTHPAGTIARARQDALTHRVLDELEGPLWMGSKHSFVYPEERRMPAVKDSLRWDFARSAAALGRRLGEPWALGETFTVADIVLTHVLDWSRAAKFPYESPELDAYRDRARARPAYRRAAERAAA